ncbi:MAG: EAL domain-containing protein [Acidaminococcaceae bacterium]
MKYSQLRKILLLATIVLILSSCFHTVTFATTNRQQNKVKVAWITTDGFFTIDQNNNRSGYGYDYLDKIAEHTGWKYEFIICSFPEAMQKVAQGEIDLITPLAYKENREADFEYARYPLGAALNGIYICKAHEEHPNRANLALEDLVIGTTVDEIRKEGLDIFAKTVEEPLQIITYPTIEAAKEACLAHEIDAVVLSDFEKSEQFSVVKYLNLIPFYVATAKGNTKIIDGVNYGMQEIKLFDRFYEKNLYEKYNIFIADYAVIFTKKEQAYLASHPVLKVGVDIQKKPVEYLDADTGLPVGISVDLTKKIAEKCGIKFEFVHPKNLTNSIEMLNNGKLDILSGLIKDKDFASAYNFKQSESYLNSYYVFLGKEHKTNKELKGLTAAINVEHVGLPYHFQKKYPALNIVSYDNMENGLTAAKNGSVDFLIMNSLMANSVLNIYDAGELTVQEMRYSSFPVAFGVSTTASPELLSILNKSIAAITEGERNNIILNYTTGAANKLTFEEILRKYAALFIGLLFLFFGVLLSFSARNKKKLERLAFYDALTGERNLVKFKLDIVPLMRQKQQMYSIVALDINNFKAINDIYGYQHGDLVLLQLALALKKALHPGEIFCRGDGDNFYLLLRSKTREYEPKRFLAFTTKIDHFSFGDNTKCKIILKIGIYQLTDENVAQDNIETMIDRANIARKSIGHCHAHSYAIYDQTMYNNVNFEKTIENNMDTALAEEQFQVYLQPKVALATELVIGAEALVRWQHPTQGFIYPDDFIPLFEKNGFVTKLDFYMFEHVCALLERWQKEGRRLYPISVNFSRKHLLQTDTVERLRQILEGYQVNPRLIEIEITESSFTNLDRVQIASFMSQLHQIGFGISLDDFGSGYSSLSMLSEYDFDVLKLDRSFLEHKYSNEKTTILIGSIITLSQKLNILPISEGVETQEQVEFLQSVGCAMAQGYFFSKPLPLAEYEKVVKFL